MNKEIITTLGALTLILIIALGILGPLATIFAVNTLFSVGWVYSFANWFSVAWLQFIAYGIGRAASKK